MWLLRSVRASSSACRVAPSAAGIDVKVAAVAASILICDDEEEIRAAMKRTLQGFELTEASSPAEALAILKTRGFDAIVSDFALAADRDGLDLLQHVRVQYPVMARFLVTGNQNLDVVVRALDEGAVHRYFTKPWDDEKLRAAIEIVLHSRNVTMTTGD